MQACLHWTPGIAVAEQNACSDCAANIASSNSSKPPMRGKPCGEEDIVVSVGHGREEITQ